MIELTRTNRGTIMALCLIYAFGLNSMYGLVYRNGYINALIKLRYHGPHVLPGSNTPILTTFTGLRPLDQILTLAGVLFANINDGSTPQLSLYAFHFAGQLVSIFTVVMIEGRRRGNKRGVMSLSVRWGCAIQGLGYGFTMPLYAITHLINSATATTVSPALANAVRTQDPIMVETLVPSIIIGYILPSILMTIPLSSPVIHQWFAGFWQGFPMWITLFSYAIGLRRRGLSRALGKDGGSCVNEVSTVGDRIGEAKTLHKTYLFALAVSTLTHLATFGIIVSSNFFPSLFPPSLNFRDVFVPPVFYSRAPMKNMAIGIQNFFQYDQYVGSAAAIVWAIKLHCNSLTSPMTLKHWMWLVGEVLVVGLIAGPSGALVSLMWNRDERILNDDGLYEQKER